MRVFRVLVSYPPSKEQPKRRRAVFLGEIEVGDANGHHDSLVDGYAAMIQLLKKINKGKNVVKKPRWNLTYDTVALKNGVIIYLDTDPVQPLETWLKQASELSAAPKRSKKK